MQKLQEKINEVIIVFDSTSSTAQLLSSHDHHSKQIQQNISNNRARLVEQYLSKIAHNDAHTIEIVIQAIKFALTDPSMIHLHSTKSLFDLIYFLKKCVDSWNPFLIQRLKSEIIGQLVNYLKKQHRKPKQEQPSTNNNQQDVEANQNDAQINQPSSSSVVVALSNSISHQKNESNFNQQRTTQLISECLFVWQKWFTADKILESAVNELSIEEFIPQDNNNFEMNEPDILYRDVESLLFEKKIAFNKFIFIDNSLFFEQFMCQKQGKIISSKLVTRKVSFVDDKLYQIELEKGVQMKKTIPFPDLFVLQEKSDQIHLKKGSKHFGLELKLSWEDPIIEKYPFRLLCRRGNENRSYAIYFPSQPLATMIKDYIHYTKSKADLPHMKLIFKQLAGRFRASLAEQYFEKKILPSDLSTQCSSLQLVDDQILPNSSNPPQIKPQIY